MANRNKRIPLDKVDEMIEEIDIISEADPELAKSAIGDKVYVNMPKYCRSIALYRQKQYEAGIITHEQMSAGCIKIQGNLLYPNKTYELELTPDLKELLRRGVLRGGGRMQHTKERSPVYSHEEVDKMNEKGNQEIYTCQEQIK